MESVIANFQASPKEVSFDSVSDILQFYVNHQILSNERGFRRKISAGIFGDTNLSATQVNLLGNQ